MLCRLFFIILKFILILHISVDVCANWKRFQFLFFSFICCCRHFRPRYKRCKKSRTLHRGVFQSVFPHLPLYLISVFPIPPRSVDIFFHRDVQPIVVVVHGKERGRSRWATLTERSRLAPCQTTGWTRDRVLSFFPGVFPDDVPVVLDSPRRYDKKKFFSLAFSMIICAFGNCLCSPLRCWCVCVWLSQSCIQLNGLERIQMFCLLPNFVWLLIVYRKRCVERSSHRNTSFPFFAISYYYYVFLITSIKQ